MPALLLLAFASTVGIVVGLVAWRYPRIARPSAGPTLDTARKVGATVGRHPTLRAFLRARLDPAAATGLALTLAMVVAIGGGVLFGVLAYLVRTKSELIVIDNGVAKWGNHHASTMSTHILDVVTQLGGIYAILVLCLVLAVAETIRERSVWVIPFIVAVMGGEEILTATVKQLADRVRPTFNPAAATLGPSFPSGHSATAAAFYAMTALLLGRWRGRPTRAVLTGAAAGLAVAVAASRVLLDVHWLSDVIAGLALGWGWFAVCAIAFGGRILRFGVAAEAAARVADVAAVGETGSGGPARPPLVGAQSRDHPDSPSGSGTASSAVDEEPRQRAARTA
jgi:membrane-associated phospholipid phosphatase